MFNYSFFTVRFLLFVFVSGLHVGCTKNSSSKKPNGAAVFIRGVDLSFTPEIRTTSTLFKYKNAEKDILSVCKEVGINTVRLRLWYSPVTKHSGLAEVTEFANEIKSKGLNILLDIHYSDTWADPGKQSKPMAWNSITVATLHDSIYAYTKRVVQLLADAGAKPAIVQVGNEINSGFLWDDGRIGGVFDPNWSNFTKLIKQGIKAVKDVDPDIKTMIHFAGYEDADWFYKQIKDQGVDYDYMGISYYPMFHGKDIDRMYQKLSSLVTTFNKQLIIVETSYPFTLGWNDYTHNLLGSSDQLIPAYPATEVGQAQFVTALIKRLKALPGNKGVGLIYWAPDWVAYRGSTALDGSSAENQALFNFSNNAVPAFDSLGKVN